MIGLRLIDNATRDLIPGASWTFNHPGHLPEYGQTFLHNDVEYQIVSKRWSVMQARVGVNQMRLDLIVTAQEKES